MNQKNETPEEAPVQQPVLSDFTRELDEWYWAWGQKEELIQALEKIRDMKRGPGEDTDTYAFNRNWTTAFSALEAVGEKNPFFSDAPQNPYTNLNQLGAWNRGFEAAMAWEKHLGARMADDLKTKIHGHQDRVAELTQEFSSSHPAIAEHEAKAAALRDVLNNLLAHFPLFAPSTKKEHD